MGNEMDFGTYGTLAVNYDLDNEFDSDRFIKMRLRVCHDGVNRNGSNFTVENMEDAEPTLGNIPILAHVLFDEDGNPQFGGHDMAIEKSKTNDGEYKMIYQEVPIGVVPETCNPEIKEYEGKQYVYCDAYIWRGYSNYAEDIIDRDKDIKLSMEITVDDCSFNAEKKVYNVTKYRYRGITFLGNDLQTGMINAVATTNFTEDSKEQMIVIMKELKEALEKFSANSQAERGEKEMDDITKVATTDADEGAEVNKNFTDTTIDTPEQTEVTPETPVAEDYVLTFKISHEDIKWSLYSLIETDGCYCMIQQVFDDNFIYYDYCESKYYRQGYSVADENVSLVGDKVEMFPMMLTADEKSAVEAMQSEYESLKTEVEGLREFKAKADTESHNAEIQSVIDKWSEHLDGNEEFENIKNSSFAELKADDVDVKCKCIFADSKATFSAVKTAPKDTMVRFSLTEDTDTTEKPYGGIFDEYAD